MIMRQRFFLFIYNMSSLVSKESTTPSLSLCWGSRMNHQNQTGNRGEALSTFHLKHWSELKARRIMNTKIISTFHQKLQIADWSRIQSSDCPILRIALKISKSPTERVSSSLIQTTFSKVRLNTYLRGYLEQINSHAYERVEAIILNK